VNSNEDAIAVYTSRARRFVGLVGLLILGVFTIGTLLTRPNGATGIIPGHKLPPFAVPLAPGTLNGDANIATRPDSGNAGSRAACTVRGQEILNICELYERGPVVLALFINAGSCPGILNELQTLAPSFPGVQFAGVAVKGSRTQLRQLVRTRRLTVPIGYDHDGVLASLYRMVSCPQITFAYPGGVAAPRPLLGAPSLAVLRSRVTALVSAARARGWKPGLA
jgi:hypothetical protein